VEWLLLEKYTEEFFGGFTRRRVGEEKERKIDGIKEQLRF